MTARPSLAALLAAVVVLLGPLLWGAGPAAAVQPRQASVPTVVSGTQPILFVFDVSSSMGETDSGGVPRLEGAKAAAVKVIYDLPASASVGVWAYPEDGDCGAGASLLDPTALDVSALTARIQKLQPQGNTPTAVALQAAADSLRARGFTSGTIVLVSDGEANCAADPCETAKAITSNGFDLTVETTGFNISESGRQQLECISAATNGTYVDVTNSEELAARLADAARPTLGLTVTGLDGNARADARTTVGVTVTNNNPSVVARDVTVSLSFGSGGADAVYPAVIPPVLRLGNVAGGQSVSRSWTLSTGRPGTAYGRVVAQAQDAQPQSASGSLRIQSGTAARSDAGAVLAEAAHALILGDSYSAGEGAGSYEKVDGSGELCHRSRSTYAVRLFEGFDSRDLVACSGAVTADYGSPNPDRDRESQRSYLYGAFADDATAPDVVLMTFGGNDIGFADVVKTCAMPSDCTARTVDSADAAYGVDLWTSLKLRDAAAIEPTLAQLYYDVADDIARSTQGRQQPVPLVVLPYLQIITSTIGDGCSNLGQRERSFGVDLLRVLDDSIARAVDEARSRGALVYLARDVTAAVLPGHTACADDAADRFINPVRFSVALQGNLLDAACVAIFSTPGLPPSPAAVACGQKYFESLGPKAQELMHPNTKGYSAITDALVTWSSSAEVEEAWATDRTQPIPDRGWLAVSDSMNSPTLSGVTTVDLGQLVPGTVVGVTAGGQIDLRSTGLAPGSTVLVRLESAPLTLASATVGADGSLVRSVPVPDTVAPGVHHLVVEATAADGTSRLLVQTLEVHRATPLWLWLVLAVAMLLVGAAAVLAWRLLRSGHASAGTRSGQPIEEGTA